MSSIVLVVVLVVVLGLCSLVPEYDPRSWGPLEWCPVVLVLLLGLS